MKWPKVRLRDLAVAKYGGALKAEDRVSDGSFDVYGSNGLIGKHTQTLISSATIVVGRKGAVGELTYAQQGGWIIDTAFYLDQIDPKVDLRYLFYALGNMDLKRLTITTSIPGLNRDQLLDIELPLPPLDEQRRIAAILDKAEHLRSIRARTLAQLNNAVTSLYLDMFGDPIVNSKQWPIEKLGLLGSLDRGVSKHRPRNAPELLGGKHPLVQTGDVANSDGYIQTYKATYSDVGLRQSKKWPAGTLCITIAANIGKTGILRFDACFPDSVVGFLTDIPGRAVYVQTWMSFVQKRLEDSAPESAQKNINLAILRDLDVPNPPARLQQEFANRVDKIQRIRAMLLESSHMLDYLSMSIQNSTFSSS
jgi:type I restriction enzyme, S subunit